MSPGKSKQPIIKTEKSDKILSADINFFMSIPFQNLNQLSSYSQFSLQDDWNSN